jgi:hypothetical protein
MPEQVRSREAFQRFAARTEKILGSFLQKLTTANSRLLEGVLMLTKIAAHNQFVDSRSLP